MHAALLDPTAQAELNDDHDVIGTPLVREQLEGLLGSPRRNGLGDPERALMRALLLDAVLCIIGQSAPATDRPRLAADARAWIASRSRAWVFAFESVCEALAFDAAYLRRRLFALADAHCLSDAAPQHLRTADAVRAFRKGAQRRRRALHFVPRGGEESA